jgi:hypothetical protein
MCCRSGDTGLLRVELSSFEAAQLSGFLEERIQRRHHLECDVSSVHLAVERLLDATMAAIWLRENVFWEMTFGEAFEVQDALSSELAKERTGEPDRADVLDNIIAKLTYVRRTGPSAAPHHTACAIR